MKYDKLLLALVVAAVMLCGCGQKGKPVSESNDAETEQMETTDNSVEQTESDAETEETEETMSKAELAASYFEGLKANLGYKGINETNPLMTQRFGADPYAMEYDGRVYFYMTADSFEYDAAGNVKENSYSTINTINVISTDDMVNFTDHGAVYAAGPLGIYPPDPLHCRGRHLRTGHQKRGDRSPAAVRASPDRHRQL